MHNLFKALIAITLLTSCNQNTIDRAPVSKDLSPLVHKFFDCFNGHKWEDMAAMYSETADFIDPSLGTGIVKQTRKQTAEKYKNLENFSKDIRDEIVSMYPSGEKCIIVEFISSGTTPDGTKWSLPLCTVFTIENGQITKDHTYYDMECTQQNK